MHHDTKKVRSGIPSYDVLTEGWFSARPVINYGRHLMCVTGKRTSGKSTGVSLWLLLEYLKTGKGWIYTRRTKDETQLTAPDWFDNACDIINAYLPKEQEKHVLYKGGKYYFVEGPLKEIDEEGNEKERSNLYDDDKICGIAIPLSQQQKYKGSNFSWVNYIVYDEFVVFEGSSPYLGGYANPILEYRMLMSLYQTADRGVGVPYRNEVKIFCLGNNDSYATPIYSALGVDKYIRSDTHFLAPKNEEWVVQQLRQEDTEKLKDYKDSVSYKLADSRTREYAFENVAKEEADVHFVKKLQVTMHPMFNARFDGYDMTVYQYSQGLYVKPGKASGVHTYALTLKDHTPDRTLTCGSYGFPLQRMKQEYSDGYVTFENRKCKMCFDSYFKFV